MTLKPKFARVLIEREKIVARGLIIPDSAEKRNAPARGKVIAVGPNCDASIAPGMVVLFGQFAGAWVKVEDKEIYVCNDEDIIAEIDEHREPASTARAA